MLVPVSNIAVAGMGIETTVLFVASVPSLVILSEKLIA